MDNQNHITVNDKESSSASSCSPENLRGETKIDNNLHESLQRVIRKQGEVRKRRRFICSDGEKEIRNNTLRKTVTSNINYFDTDEHVVYQPVLEEWLEVEDELDEAQRNLIEAREERKAAQRDREAARKERLEAQKDRESARKERLKAQSERIEGRNERLNAKKEREECRTKRLESQKKRQETRQERLLFEMELKEIKNQRKDTKGGERSEIDETQIELFEVNVELEESKNERDEAKKDEIESLDEQIEERLEHDEEIHEREIIDVQSIKVEEYFLDSDGEEKVRKFSTEESNIIGNNLGEDMSISLGICETIMGVPPGDHEKYEFRCLDCGNGYNKRSSFMRHVKTHSTAEHECHLCKKMFVRVDVLRRHIKNMHGEIREELISPIIKSTDVVHLNLNQPRSVGPPSS